VSPQELDAEQRSVDEVVAEWPEVRAKQVFGHRGYVRGGKMFGFQADVGVAVKAPAGDVADALYGHAGVVPFIYNGAMEMRAWPVLPLRDDSEIAAALTALKDAYDRAG